MIIFDEIIMIDNIDNIERHFYIGLLFYNKSDKDNINLTESSSITVLFHLKGYIIKNKWFTPKKIYNWILNKKGITRFASTSYFKSKTVTIKKISIKNNLSNKDYLKLVSSYPLAFKYFLNKK